MRGAQFSDAQSGWGGEKETTTEETTKSDTSLANLEKPRRGKPLCSPLREATLNGILCIMRPRSAKVPPWAAYTWPR